MLEALAIYDSQPQRPESSKTQVGYTLQPIIQVHLPETAIEPTLFKTVGSNTLKKENSYSTRKLSVSDSINSREINCTSYTDMN